MLSLLPQFHCEDKNKCTGPYASESYFSFKLIDKYNMNLIAGWGATYISDSVYVTKADGSMPKSLDISSGGRIGFEIAENILEARDSSVSKIFLLYLPDFDGTPRQDVDTIQFRYRFNGSCFDSLAIWYNDSLYHDDTYIDFISFIKK